jgi:hypothetical protein
MLIISNKRLQDGRRLNGGASMFRHLKPRKQLRDPYGISSLKHSSVKELSYIMIKLSEIHRRNMNHPKMIESLASKHDSAMDQIADFYL